MCKLSARLISALLPFLSFVIAPVRSLAADFKREVVYQIITDRFFDGDPNNNNPPQSSGLFDSTKTDFQAYWGGDLAGIQQKLSYLADMGVTAIWISPPIDNENKNQGGAQIGAPYHGYQGHDFKRIEEHFGDASNSFAAFDNLVTAAHAKGVKVIVDFAPIIRITTIMASSAPSSTTEPWWVISQTTPTAFSTTIRISATSTTATRTSTSRFPIWRISIRKTPPWTPTSKAPCKSSSSITWMASAWTLSNTRPGAGFTASSTVSTPPPIPSLSGNGSPIPRLIRPITIFTSSRTGRASQRSIFPFITPSTMSSRDNSFSEIGAVLSQEASNFQQASDLVTFIDNHDRQRFLSINNNKNRLHEALAFLLTSHGVPVIYYGTEQYLHNDTKFGNDPFNRPQMTSFDTTTDAYKLIAKLAALRKNNPAIAYGTTMQRWINRDLYIFDRAFAGLIRVKYISSLATFIIPLFLRA